MGKLLSPLTKPVSVMAWSKARADEIGCSTRKCTPRLQAYHRLSCSEYICFRRNSVNVSRARCLIITQCCKQKTHPGHMYNIRITKMLARRVHRRRFPSGSNHDLPVEGLLLGSEGIEGISSIEIDGIQTNVISILISWSKFQKDPRIAWGGKHQ